MPIRYCLSKSTGLLSTVTEGYTYKEGDVHYSTSIKSHELFFSHTAGRWLYNEKAHQRARYMRFNVEGLTNLAAKVVGSPVIELRKLIDTNNRAVLLTHENRTETVARIPTPISGPRTLTTASEVATMDFVRRLGLPVPKVLAWSAIPESTEVKSEFILMEKAVGRPLHEIVAERGVVDIEDLGRKVARMLRPLVETRFNCYGSLFYKEDLDVSERIDDFLANAPAGVDTSPFCVGPIVRRDFWEDERALMRNVYRGPWTSALDFARDTATREERWIERFAKPHFEDNFLCGHHLQGKQDDHILLLEDYKKLLPYIIPKDLRHLYGHLWHPRLSANTLFVVPSSASAATEPGGKVQVDITSCITWPGASIEPAFRQLTTPSVCRSLNAPRELFPLSQAQSLDMYESTEYEKLRAAEEEKERREMFERIAFAGLGIDEEHLPGLMLRQEMDVMARGTWRTGLLPFRKALIEVANNFHTIAPGEECPISFTADQIGAQALAYKAWEMHKDCAATVARKLGVEESGYVRGGAAQPEYFEHVQKEATRWRDMFLSNVKDEKKRWVAQFYWPFRDTIEDDPRTFSSDIVKSKE
ncbi:hypothetical protein BDN70DRAFT_955270 [Pholiota conissans]|uniref:Altered inheritance of mitochondria protein 9, mitochondrial n=1 Tax=Pholiota conissans TaxID=109636 RepID=A0A9P5YTM6_9AGAR|nr:hypothetical protein BDN70DRAFT_955270 [Pholiota conissans]